MHLYALLALEALSHHRRVYVKHAVLARTVSMAQLHAQYVLLESPLRRVRAHVLTVRLEQTQEQTQELLAEFVLRVLRVNLRPRRRQPRVTHVLKGHLQAVILGPLHVHNALQDSMHKTVEAACVLHVHPERLRVRLALAVAEHALQANMLEII